MFDFVLILRGQFLEYLRETLYKHALEHLKSAGPFFFFLGGGGVFFNDL